MAGKKKNPKDSYVRQLLYLASGIMLATFMLLVIPGSTSPNSSAPNDIDKRIDVSRAADQYLVASSPEERQAAAGMVRAAREGSRSREPVNASDFYAFLRVLSLITIVLFLYRILVLIFSYYKPVKKARQV